MSSQPTLDHQSWHLLKIRRVLRKHRATVLQSNRCDLEVHRADPDACPSKRAEAIGSSRRPGQQRPLRIEFKPRLQSAVRVDLVVNRPFGMDLRQPTTQLLLSRNNGGHGIDFGPVETPSERASSSGTTLDLGEMISVQNQHRAHPLPVVPAGTPCRVGSSRRNRDRSRTCRLSGANPGLAWLSDRTSRAEPDRRPSSPVLRGGFRWVSSWQCSIRENGDHTTTTALREVPHRRQHVRRADPAGHPRRGHAAHCRASPG